MAVCPCKTCPRRGCGKAHDTCDKYKEWKLARERANARRGADAEITRAIISARLRIKREKR
jgi:hypothetical protein